MDKEIKEIRKPTIQLLNKVEHILADELSSEEYDEFYNYFNEIRKPDILIDIKDVDIVRKCVEDLQQRIEKAVEYILDEGITFLNIAGQRTWRGKHSCTELLNILKGDDTNE